MNVLRSGSIWWAIAFHAAWDGTEESFYGTIGSGDGHGLAARDSSRTYRTKKEKGRCTFL